MGNCYQRAPNLNRGQQKLIAGRYQQSCTPWNSSNIAKNRIASTEVRRWERLQCVGNSPCDRSGHGSIILGSKAYVFGGCGGPAANGTCLRDFYCFDLETLEWQRIRGTGEAPSARASFSMNPGADDGTIIIAGGTGDQNEGLQGDVFEFNVHTQHWRKLADQEACGEEESFCQYYGQSMVQYKGALVFFGGSTGTQYTNATFRFDPESQQVEQLQTTGQPPSPRYKHQALVVGRHMYIFGGGNYKPPTDRIDVHRLDLDTLVWEPVLTHGPRPQARVAHSCVLDAEAGRVYLWGGFTATLERLRDFHAFDLAGLAWSAVRPAAPPPPAPAAGAPSAEVGAAAGGAGAAGPSPRAFHAAFFHQGAVWLFGGADGDKRHSDMWRFALRARPASLMLLSARAVLASSQHAPLLVAGDGGASSPCFGPSPSPPPLPAAAPSPAPPVLVLRRAPTPPNPCLTRRYSTGRVLAGLEASAEAAFGLGALGCKRRLGAPPGGGADAAAPGPPWRGGRRHSCPAAGLLGAAERLRAQYGALPGELRAAMAQVDAGLDRFSRARSVSGDYWPHHAPHPHHAPRPAPPSLSS